MSVRPVPMIAKADGSTDAKSSISIAVPFHAVNINVTLDFFSNAEATRLCSQEIALVTRRLDIAFWDYDRTRALMDGSIAIDGVAPRFHTARIVPEIFEAMIRKRAYDVSELGMTYFLRTFDGTDSPFVAMPVFTNRAFRHSAIYVNKHAGIMKPEDLNGKRIGELALYGHDAGIMPKGILSDEYGFRPESCHWIVGGIDFPMEPIDFVVQPHPSDTDVTMAAPGADLGAMLESGEIDALISADIPRCILEKSPNAGRLFENHVEIERDYFRRTGIFPIMHTVVVKRELAERDPDLVKAVYRGFCQAKQSMEERLVQGMTFNNMDSMVPWMTSLLDTNRTLLGQDWWPYGLSENFVAVDTVLRYHHEQGITKRRFAVEEIFATCLLQS